MCFLGLGGRPEDSFTDNRTGSRTVAPTDGVRRRIRRSRFRPRSGSRSHVSGPHSPNRAYRFPAPRSLGDLVPPRQVASPPRQAHRSHRVAEQLVRIASPISRAARRSLLVAQSGNPTSRISTRCARLPRWPSIPRDSGVRAHRRPRSAEPRALTSTSGSERWRPSSTRGTTPVRRPHRQPRCRQERFRMPGDRHRAS